jgi:hypothetical protein
MKAILHGVAGWGDWHPGVPEGRVVCLCAPCSHDLSGARSGAGRYLLIPAADYRSPGFTAASDRYPESKTFPQVHADLAARWSR